MDHAWLDSIARRLAAITPRRGVLHVVAGVALGVVGLGAGQPASAACRDAGARCQRGAQCCSGRCAGKKNKKRCKAAPDQGICTIANDACLTSEEVPCATGVDFDCQCLRTTAGLSFCANKVIVASPRILGCDGDASCAETFGEGARCIRPGLDCGDLPFCAQPCPTPA
jgi:hypothetical protein